MSNLKLKKNEILIKVISFCVFFLIFYACENNKDEVYYSCDASIDTTIKENISKYQKMVRQEWQQLPDSLKVPVYRTFNEKQKAVFWKNKLQELMVFFKDNYYSKQHITKLYNYANSHSVFLRKSI